jgi:threonine dehydrogenase-like Zn-dependent dehydrogenase
MKALTWQGVNKLAIETVDDPQLVNSEDAIIRVTATATCGSDLHLIDGYVPAMREGDVIGHEFMGEVVEIGPDVRGLSVGDRVVVPSVIACGRCWYCKQGMYSCCDNGNPQPAIAETAYGFAPAGIFGYSHAMGGFAGSHAEYVRVPFADYGCFKVPDALPDDAAVYASDGVPTGWMGADMCQLRGGEVVAVWGAGGVGQMAARSAYLLGAEQVVVIDRLPERLAQAERYAGAVPLDYTEVNVVDALRELTGGRGPDACIEAVGMEAHGTGPQYVYDRAKQAARLQTDRGLTVRQAIMACRKGGTVSILGVFGGVIDKFPLGAVVNKALTIRSGQQHGQRYVPMLLERMARGEIETAHLTTHPMPLSEAVEGYEMFKKKQDGCVRAVFHPAA